MLKRSSFSLGGLCIREEEDALVIADIQEFELEPTFACGQAFRWRKECDDTYTGVVRGKVINVGKRGNDLILKNTNRHDFQNIWYEYFDLGRDYQALKKQIAIDDHMQKAVLYGSGMRILKQEFFEALISFILSGNNHFQRIMNIVESLSVLSEQTIRYQERIFYAFPTPATIVQCGISGLTPCKMGYRTKYVANSTQRYQQVEHFQKKLLALESEDAVTELMQFEGVGRKVAECVLLFSHTKMNVFPVDVWIKRAMETLYIKKEVSASYVHAYGKELFGENSGIAQQYLFYYARKHKIGCG